MTIVEFLLERFDEDEADIMSRDDFQSTGPASARRLLADLKAKRRLVDPYGAECERGPSGPGQTVTEFGRYLDAERALVPFAASYADHPDCAWRP